MDNRIESGSTVKIERTDKGWKAFVALPNGGFIGHVMKEHSSFDEAVASIKKVVTGE